MRTLLGPSGSGIQWDDKEKGANKPNVDKWGNDRIRLGKLRIASVDKGGFRAENIQGNDLDLNERSRAKDGRFVADLALPTVSAQQLGMTTPALEAAGIQLTGLKVYREFQGAELTDFFAAPGDSRIEVQKAVVTGLKSPAMEAHSLSAEGLGVSTDGTNHAVSAAGMQGKGLAAGGVTLANAEATAATMSIKPGELGFAAQDAAAGGVETGDATFATIGTHGFSIKSGPGGISARASSADAAGITAPGVAVANAQAEGLGVESNHGTTTLAADRLQAGGVDAKGFHADKATIAGGSLSTTGVGAQVAVKQVHAQGLVAGGATIGSLSGSDGELAVGDGTAAASLASAEARDIRGGGMVLESATAEQLTADVGPGGTTLAAADLAGKNLSGHGLAVADTTAKGAKLGSAGGMHFGADELQARDITGGGASASSASLTGAALDIAGGQTSARARNASASNVAVAGFKAKSATGSGLSAKSGSGGTSIGVDKLSADTLSGAGMAISSAEANKLAVNTGNAGARGKTTVSAAGTAASGVHFRSQAAARGGAGGSLMRQAAGLIDSAHLSASLPLNAQTMGEGTGRMTVKPGTTAFVEVQVQGGRIVPTATKASFSKPLDTWGWTTVPGIYISKEGKLFAEVSGLWDKDLTADMNKALGRSGSVIPLRVADLAKSAGGGGAGGNTLARFDELKASGTVGLKPGTIASGGTSATVGSGQGANVAKVEVDGSRSLSVQFSKLLLEAFGIRAGGATVDVQNIVAGNASLREAGGRTDMSASTLRTGAASITR
jgi:hypothetical protein